MEVHEIRKAIRQRVDLDTFERMIEADEGYFSVEALQVRQNARRGIKTKSNVMVIL